MSNSAFFFSGSLIYWNSEGQMYEPYLESLSRFIIYVDFKPLLVFVEFSSHR